MYFSLEKGLCALWLLGCCVYILLPIFQRLKLLTAGKGKIVLCVERESICLQSPTWWLHAAWASYMTLVEHQLRSVFYWSIVGLQCVFISAVPKSVSVIYVCVCTHIYTYTHRFFFIFFPIVVYHRIFNRVLLFSSRTFLLIHSV